MDSKNGDSNLGSLDNPLPDGSDQASCHGNNTGLSGGGAEAGVSSGSEERKTVTATSCEITTISLRLVLPGVSQAMEVMVSGVTLGTGMSFWCRYSVLITETALYLKAGIIGGDLF